MDNCRPSDAQSDKKRSERGSVRGIVDCCRGFVTRTFMDLLSVDECRKTEVRDDIAVGSTPRATYYLLLSISVLIKSLVCFPFCPNHIIEKRVVLNNEFAWNPS